MDQVLSSYHVLELCLTPLCNSGFLLVHHDCHLTELKHQAWAECTIPGDNHVNVSTTRRGINHHRLNQSRES